MPGAPFASRAPRDAKNCLPVQGVAAGGMEGAALLG